MSSKDERRPRVGVLVVYSPYVGGPSKHNTICFLLSLLENRKLENHQRNNGFTSGRGPVSSWCVVRRLNRDPAFCTFTPMMVDISPTKYMVGCSPVAFHETGFVRTRETCATVEYPQCTRLSSIVDVVVTESPPHLHANVDLLRCVLCQNSIAPSFLLAE